MELHPMASGIRSCAKSTILDLIRQMTSCCMMPSTVECMVWAENADKVNAKCVGISIWSVQDLFWFWNAWFWSAFVKSNARSC